MLSINIELYYLAFAGAVASILVIIRVLMFLLIRQEWPMLSFGGMNILQAFAYSFLARYFYLHPMNWSDPLRWKLLISWILLDVFFLASGIGYLAQLVTLELTKSRLHGSLLREKK